jgi:hypothetical protein
MNSYWLSGLGRAVAIWPADWSQFVPDAILTVATGVVVGVLLWLWQTNAERRTAVQAAESNWEIARPHFMSVVDPLTPTVDDGYLVLAVARLDPLIEEGKRYPIGSWAKTAPKNRELATLREILIDAPNLQRLAAELSRHFEREIVRLGEAPAWSTDEYERAAMFVILELPLPPHLQGRYADVVNSRLVNDAHGGRLLSEFRRLFRKVQLDIDDLRVQFFGP